jgi:predicted membrane metal-binding protein
MADDGAPKAPHGARNPHGFDYELLQWEQGVQAVGYVRAGRKDPMPERLDTALRYPVLQLRERVRDAILAELASVSEGPADLRAAGVVAALVTGDQRAIDRSDWNVFRATGVAHLVSISGLHITLFAWLAVQVVGALWRRAPRLCLAFPAQSAGLVGGLLLAGLVCAVQRLGRAGAAHGADAGGGGGLASGGAALALAAHLAAGVRGGGVARPLGLAAGRFLAELCCGGGTFCYQPNSC